jgi:hypothetical protein
MAYYKIPWCFPREKHEHEHLEYVVMTYGHVLPSATKTTWAEFAHLITQVYDQDNPRNACVVELLNSVQETAQYPTDPDLDKQHNFCDERRNGVWLSMRYRISRGDYDASDHFWCSNGERRAFLRKKETITWHPCTEAVIQYFDKRTNGINFVLNTSCSNEVAYSFCLKPSNLENKT